MAITTDGSPSTTIDESQPHDHDANGNAVAITTTTPGEVATDGTPVPAWPRPWDPSQPIDVAGVPGVTTEEEARATKLIEGSLKDLPKYADTAAAIADGYASIGDAGTGSEHYIKSCLIEDDDFLDPQKPESLVYTVNGDQRTLAGAMYIASARPTDDPACSPLRRAADAWHNHGNLCWAPGADGKPQVVGITDANGNCANGVNTGGGNPMVHVWVTPHPCGVFAALEGVGAGQAAVPPISARLSTICNQRHTPRRRGGRPLPSRTTRRSRSISVASPVVTPEQQAAAENLVALNVVRLPQWADYKTAEAAGYHSIGDGLHRLRALHQVGPHQRQRLAGPRPSREPRVPTAAGWLEEARQRDVLPARHGGADRRARHRRRADAVAHPRQPVLHRRPGRTAGRRRDHSAGTARTAGEVHARHR